MSVAVLGSGAFGTALASALAAKTDVTLWSRSAAQIDDMNRNGRNDARLPGIKLHPRVRPEADLLRALAHDILLVAVPMQKLRSFLISDAPRFAGKHVIACCKGIELDTGLGPVSVIEDVVPDATAALLTGPSFADEIARNLPTALTLACRDGQAGQTLQTRLSTDLIRLYRVTDTTGAELGGALKNVIAIACGAVMGAGLGNSARAAVMTRGYAEMLRLVVALGGDAETLAGLSGFGDLVLTCGSDQSRNYRLGLAIGQEDTFDPRVTVEGAATAQAVDKLADQREIDMPITRSVAELVEGKQTLKQVISGLLARSLKEE